MGIDKRKFLQSLGVAGGCAIMPVPAMATLLKPNLAVQVSNKVLSPEEVIKDPLGCPVFDMNNDASSIAAWFTMDLCIEYTKKATGDEAMAMLQWGMRQPAVIGLFMAKVATRRVMICLDEPEQNRIAGHHVFKAMYTKYGPLLDNTGANVLGQWERLRWDNKSD